MKMSKNSKELQYRRFIEIVESENNNKIWNIDELLKRVNFLLTSNLEISKEDLQMLITRQRKFKIFRYHSRIGNTTYYIFRKTLPKC